MKKFFIQAGYFLFLFFVLNFVLEIFYGISNYNAIQNKTHKNYLKWNDIHKNKNNYDLIILGSSRAYTTFNPVIFDSILSVKSYNMGTSSQDIAESYYTLEEVFQYQKPKYIVLDLFFPSSDNSHDFYQIFSNSSFFKSSRRKYNLITKSYGYDGITNYLIPMVKLKNYIKQDISRIFKEKKQLKKETNWIKGYLYDNTIVSNNEILNFTPISNFNNTQFDRERFKKYFKKIKKLTEENNAILICTRAPYPPKRFLLNNIDDEGDYYKKFMKKISVKYFDLNNKENNQENFINQDFSDYHHSNFKGAEKASKILSEKIKLYR